jgi:hypothetical protein
MPIFSTQACRAAEYLDIGDFSSAGTWPVRRLCYAECTADSEIAKLRIRWSAVIAAQIEVSELGQVVQPTGMLPVRWLLPASGSEIVMSIAGIPPTIHYDRLRTISLVRSPNPQDIASQLVE